MSRVLTIGVGLGLASIAMAWLVGRGRPLAAQAAPSAAPPLRDAVLSRELFRDMATDSTPVALAALMDWNLGEGIVTLAVFSDGSVSLYNSGGGGMIGGGEHESVRQAGLRFLEAVQAVQGRLAATDERAFPGPDEVRFWLVTATRTLATPPIPVTSMIDEQFWLASAGNEAQLTIAALQEASQ